MAKVHELGVTPMGSLASLRIRQFEPVAFGGSSRLTFKRLRSPTRLPESGSRSTLGRYLDRLGWMFGGG